MKSRGLSGEGGAREAAPPAVAAGGPRPWRLRAADAGVGALPPVSVPAPARCEGMSRRLPAGLSPPLLGLDWVPPAGDLRRRGRVGARREL